NHLRQALQELVCSRGGSRTRTRAGRRVDGRVSRTPRELDAPRGVHEIAGKLRRHGHQAWAVGGAVRDAVLGLPATDWDIATSARPQEVRSIFRRTVPIGIEHGTVGVLWKDGVLYEVTTFRQDVETDGRHAV